MCLNGLVHALHLAQWVTAELFAIQQRSITEDQHAKLRSPIADMIVSDYMMAKKPQRARDRVADDSRTNVTDMHGLCDIGRAEIDNDGFRLGYRFDP